MGGNDTKQHMEDFLILKGYLFKGNHFFLPRTSHRDKVIKDLHEVRLRGHFGRDNTIPTMEDKSFWPQPKMDVGDFLQWCMVHQVGKGKVQKHRPLYAPINSL